MSAQPLPTTLAALAATIDYSVLAPDATRAQVLDACAEARERGFASVCVRPLFVSIVAQMLRGSMVKTCTVISFHLGINSIADKEAEARRAITDGAEEIDWVFNYRAVLNYENDHSAMVARCEAEKIAALAKEFPSTIFKGIAETYMLNDSQKRWAYRLLAQSFGPTRFFLKTSTGFAEPRVKGDHVGATVEDVALMVEVAESINPWAEVKASGGIKTLTAALAMLEAGATRLGTGTTGADAIMAEAKAAGWQ